MVVDFTPYLCAALASLPSCHRRLNALYQAAAGECVVAARKYSGRNSRALKKGRAEKQVLAYRALGVIVHYKNMEDYASINSLLRAADRRVYDYVMTGKGEVKTAPILQEISSRDISDDEVTNLGFLLYAVIVASGRPMGDGVLVDTIKDLVKFYMGMDATHDNLAPSVLAGSKKIFAPYDRLTVDEFYTYSSAEVQSELSNLSYLSEVLGVSLTEYCEGIELTPEEAAWASLNTDRPVERATLACLFKAIHKDREFCLELASKDKTAELEAAKLEAERAKQEADQVRSRVNELERLAQEAERRAQKAEAALSEMADEVQELAALRTALYAAQTPDEPIQEQRKQRSIPKGAVLIGGHGTWARGMREALLDVTVYPASVTCDINVVRSASELWFRADYISHADYYRIVAAARQYHVPIHYFSSGGVGRCVAEFLTME